jgi:hypothetical protein
MYQPLHPALKLIYGVVSIVQLAWCIDVGCTAYKIGKAKEAQPRNQISIKSSTTLENFLPTSSQSTSVVDKVFDQYFSETTEARISRELSKQ